MESEKVLILLNGENYSRWKFKIAAVLEAKDRHDVVTGEATCPQKDESEIKAWKKRGALAPVLEAKDRHDVVTGEATCPQKDESEIKAWKKRGALARSIIL
ncbi:hypothetical protein T4D_15926 [Trichinella pseudospiralis]|uniref:DUF4219 domain-containing protein n=1 Tax=Trichinella pseudospiralis TaxID=6337 RepID=A0A0V1F6V9_TRIPS|nr:hypothetical protein T4D_15926 [Trichinella pseudospiralis]